MQRLLAVSLVLPLFLGCSAQSPDGGTPIGPDAGAGGGGGEGGGGGGGSSEEQPSLSLDELPASTPYMSIPITGSGPESGTIIVETPTESLAGDIGGDGSFCIDVPLQEGITNTIWVRAMDSSGIYSEEVEVSVAQEGEPPDGDNEEEDTTTQVKNVAKYGALDANMAVKQGQLEFVNDGDANTHARVETNYNGKMDDHILIELEQESAIQEIRVRSGDCVLKRYHVLMTDVADPASPVIDGFYDPNEPWYRVAHITDGQGDETITAPLQSEPVAKYVALVIGDTTHQGCGYFGFPKKFDVVEIEAFTEEEPAPSTPTGDSSGPTCAGGGPL